MLTTSYLALREDAVNALRERRLLDALTAIEGQIAFVDKPIFKDGVYKLRRDYSMLLEYMKRGEEDLHREEYFNGFLRRAYTISDAIHWEFQKDEGSTSRAEVWKRLRENAESLAEIYVPFVEGHDGEPATMSEIWSDPLGSYNQIFDTVWTSPLWTPEDCRSAYNYIVSSQTPAVEGLSCLAGVAMGLLSTFDEQKFLLLLSVYKEVDQIDVCARSIVFAMLAYAHYRDRIELYPSLLKKIEEMKEIPYVAQLVSYAQIGFVATWETKNLAHNSSRIEKIADSQNVMNVDVAAFAKLLSGVPVEDALPDADEKVKKMALEVLRMHRLKAAGCDVNYDTFAVLMRKIAFFKETSNWFCPFSFDNPLLFNASKQVQMIEDMFIRSSCDTGRYMTMFALMQDAVEFQIAKQDEETKEIQELDSEMLEKVTEQLSTILHPEGEGDPPLVTLDNIEPHELEELVVSCIQDVYRYFTLYPKRNETENPFNDNLEFWTDSRWAEFFTGSDRLHYLADCFSLLERYNDALYFLEQQDEAGDPSDLNFGKGVCFMEMKDFRMAIEYLERAYTQEPQITIARHLIRCHEELHDYDQVLYYLENAEFFPPENLKTMCKRGECFLNMRRFDLAIAEYSKIHYLHPDYLPSFRALAWSYLCDGQWQKASDCYNEIMGLDVIADDFFHAGHCALLQKDIPTALTCYQECLRLRQQEKAPKSFFEKEEALLLESGLSMSTLRLVLDLLNMA